MAVVVSISTTWLKCINDCKRVAIIIMIGEKKTMYKADSFGGWLLIRDETKL